VSGFNAGYSDNPRKFSKGSGGRKHHQQRPQAASTSASKPPPEFNKEVMQEDEFEVGSVFNAGSKKQNLNHLLNFQFEPRGTSSKKRNNYHQGSGSRVRKFSDSRGRPKYNKEQYLQANCQFVVKSSGDYAVHLADPDTLVNWDLIEQVVLKTTETVPSCPICLYAPKAAKITRCGHVFCWPCILHYLALSDHAWRKCPICFEAIHKQDLKSVVSNPWKEFNAGDEIEMCLMRRERHSLFALPVDKYFPQVNDKHPNLGDKYTSYSNLVLASPSQVVQGIIYQERSELEAQYRDEKDEPEACFIEEALQYLSQRESGIEIPRQVQIKEETSPILSSSSEEELKIEDFKEEEELVDNDKYRPRHTSSSSDGTFEDSEITAEDLEIKSSKNSPKETFYFYQSSDGQPIFLHALNVQMLVHEYGSLEQCPKFIRGKIIEKDNTSMTEELRNRLRYLRHLPLTSIFEVCEIQVKDFISQGTLTEFAVQLEQRRRKRNRRAREERRREKWIMVEENKRMGKYPDMKVRVESAFHFPEVGLSGAVGVPNAISTESLDLSKSPGASAHLGSSTDTTDDTFSFAKMLKTGVAKPSTYIPKSQTFPSLTPKKNEDSEPEPEDYVPPPPKASLGDALAHAFAQATIENLPENNGKKGKGKKKMKGQKISLTGSTRPLLMD